MHNDLDIGILGYGSQGSKISQIVHNRIKKKILIFSSKKMSNTKKYIFSKNLFLLKKCKIIFICSPSFTHYKYLEYFKNTAEYIFCEKPPFNKISEYGKLKKFSKHNKKKIYFNFNYLFSDQYKILKRMLLSNKRGNLIDINISIGSGISFNKKLINNWRSNNESIFTGIIGNLGIHYINLLTDLLGDVEISDIKLKKVGNFKIPDTVLINTYSKKNITSRIFLTYASPFHQNIKITFSNSIVEICNQKIIEYYPRDTFDKYNRFIKPKKKIRYNKKSNSIWSDTLKKSVEYFLSQTVKKKFFSDKKFETNIEQVKIILDKLHGKRRFN